MFVNCLNSLRGALENIRCRGGAENFGKIYTKDPREAKFRNLISDSNEIFLSKFRRADCQLHCVLILKVFPPDPSGPSFLEDNSSLKTLLARFDKKIQDRPYATADLRAYPSFSITTRANSEFMLACCLMCFYSTFDYHFIVG
jgi:hypothetical protein